MSLVMQSAVRKIHFCYGHRVMNHESKCATLHGHNGVIWVDTHWDHTMIVFKDDLKTIELLSQAPSSKAIFIFDKNPTAENLAHYLLWDVCRASAFYQEVLSFVR